MRVGGPQELLCCNERERELKALDVEVKFCSQIMVACVRLRTVEQPVHHLCSVVQEWCQLHVIPHCGAQLVQK